MYFHMHFVDVYVYAHVCTCLGQVKLSQVTEVTWSEVKSRQVSELT